MFRAAVALALLLPAASCASTPAPLSGPEWRVTAINGEPTPAPPASYRMQFDSRRVSGQFGCNHFGGDYRLRGETLIASAMMMTEMACAGPADKFEASGMAVLQQPMTLTWIAPRQVRLINAAGRIDLER